MNQSALKSDLSSDHSPHSSTPNQTQVISYVAKIGYASRGLVYLFISGLAIESALQSGASKTQGTEGAFQSMLSQPFGQILLWGTAIGLFCFAVWRVIEATLNPAKNKTLKRIGHFISGLIHVGLSFSAVKIVTASQSGSESSKQGVTAEILAKPWGAWLIGIIGVIFFAVAVVQFLQGWKKKFRDKMTYSTMSSKEKSVADIVGIAGFSSMAVVFSLVGWFLLQSAITHDSSEVGGLGKALAELASKPFGSVMVWLTALGLFCYGIYCGFVAKYFNLKG